ncbi:hypothetical protein BOTNAR_0036g00200 [Botryotinia narcissicola]|uniref:NADP-dependent oxidoreductase domain-containing protein n=1 Tax=Botryotinia narcissicola TaxID=278944 RepID=A0A4Z1J3K2_9HELO|nr:hypothetical protein BOTNAR_0036g00200 [Botryotinia narcissicola]
MANNKASKPERTLIGGSIDIPSMVSELWQLAGGHDQNVDVKAAAKAMEPLIEAGLDCFDIADHYGDAVMGQHNLTSTKKMIAFTKWCPPENGVTSFENAEKAVGLALERMKQEKMELMQFQIMRGTIRMIVSCSVIDRRHVRGRLASVCTQHDVGILAYGTLLGGYLSEKWLGVEEPKDETELNWSLRKYLRFINAAGGWSSYQVVLQALSTVAKKHGVGISAVATRHVLDLPAVSAVIVGSRLSSTSDKYTVSNLEAFSFALDAEDKALIAKAQEGLADIPGDCGDEYRRPPFLTAKGDLSDHLEETDHDLKIAKAIAGGARIEYSSGSHWEPIASYCRAVRTGNTIRVSGTTANSPVSSVPALGGKSARSQTVAILDIVARAIKALGGDMSDVVRTRIFLQKKEDVEAVSLAHGWAFKCVGFRPSNTLVVSGVIGDEFLVEIEVEAELGYREVVRI